MSARSCLLNRGRSRVLGGVGQQRVSCHGMRGAGGGRRELAAGRLWDLRLVLQELGEPLVAGILEVLGPCSILL